jgi:hypothetical protein
MRLHHPWRSGVVTLIILALLLPAGLVAAQEAPADTYPMLFPLVGEYSYTDSFGDPRSGGRTHAGIDILADKMTPVVAVASGTVRWIGEECCYFALTHDDGWESWYIHLNNDTPGTDDGLGWGLADGIEPGARVEAGQLVGWVGDSGNAEWTTSHLHFELHQPDGTTVNPYPHLLAAEPLDAPGVVGFFTDVEGSVHRYDIDRIAEAGITKGCNPPDNDQFCPDRKLTRGEMAAFLRRILELPSVEDDYFADDSDSVFQGDIDALAAAGIAFGCTETDYCPDTELLRGEMAELLVRAFGYENPDGEDYFTDDEGHAFADSINRLRFAGITKGCNPPDNTEFCPDRSLTRAEMATFFVRALGL